MDCRDQPAPSHILYTDDGDIELPTRWDVCSVCNGEGRHVNPNIDRNGISAQDFYDDPDFYDEYMSGTYDVTCYRCHGRTTERVVDWEALTPEQVEAYEQQLQDEAYDRAVAEAERRMGA